MGDVVGPPGSLRTSQSSAARRPVFEPADQQGSSNVPQRPPLEVKPDQETTYGGGRLQEGPPERPPNDPQGGAA